jgi:hypothetical protein
MGYEIKESVSTGPGYDIKMKVSVDGTIRYLYYDEIPDRCYIRGWHVYEIDVLNYNKGKREPYIRYIGSFPGENFRRADDAMYQALRDGLYIKSDRDVWNDEIHLAEDLES